MMPNFLVVWIFFLVLFVNIHHAFIYLKLIRTTSYGVLGSEIFYFEPRSLSCSMMISSSHLIPEDFCSEASASDFFKMPLFILIIYLILSSSLILKANCYSNSFNSHSFFTLISLILFCSHSL